MFETNEVKMNLEKWLFYDNISVMLPFSFHYHRDKFVGTSLLCPLKHTLFIG
jgi:hypothetical protein